MIDQYFIMNSNGNRTLTIYESENGEILKMWEFNEEISDFIVNDDEELIIGFDSGRIEFWKGA